jgi:hypothetical protein
MKKTLLFIVLIMNYSWLISQNLELKIVNSQNEPLPYSYIFINSKYFGDADSSGTILIPKSLLKTDDTISIKYVGAIDNYFIYSRIISTLDQYKTSLKQSVSLNEVFVTSSKMSSKELFNKFVKTPFIGSWFDKFSGDFEFVIKINQREDKIVTGNFQYQLLSPDYKKKNKVEEFYFTSLSDTVGYSRLVRNCLEIFKLAQYEVVLWKGASMNKKMVINYIGESDSSYMFTINRPSTNNKFLDLETSQFLLNADKKSGNPTSAEIIKIFIGGNFPEYNFKAHYLTVDRKFRIIYPSKIDGFFSSFIGDDKIVCDISFNNINYLKPKKR